MNNPWVKGLLAKEPAGKQLGRLIRRYRTGAGLTQIELSNIIGVTQPYLCQIEAGKVPGDSVLMSIIDALDIDPADLPQFSEWGPQ
jgi:transcriptional regulator with XRE-family HTH domain